MLKLSDRGNRHLLLALGMAIVTAGVFVGAVLGGRWLHQAKPARDDQYWVPQPILASGPMPPRGEAELLYHSFCSKCHGARGEGDPQALVRLTPAPRPFGGEDWRLPKTKESIELSIREGIPGTAMPPSGNLFSPEQVSALADYVLFLSERFPPPAVAKPRHNPAVSEPTDAPPAVSLLTIDAPQLP